MEHSDAIEADDDDAADDHRKENPENVEEKTVVEAEMEDTSNGGGLEPLAAKRLKLSVDEKKTEQKMDVDMDMDKDKKNDDDADTNAAAAEVVDATKMEEDDNNDDEESPEMEMMKGPLTLLDGYELIALIPEEKYISGPQRPLNRKDCEVILMVGLPGSGKTTWTLNHIQENPLKRYYVIGADSLIAKMTVTNIFPISKKIFFFLMMRNLLCFFVVVVFKG